MEKRPLNTPEGIRAELLHRAWQERAATTWIRTNKQHKAEAEHAAQAMEALAAEIERENTPQSDGTISHETLCPHRHGGECMCPAAAVNYTL